MSRSHACSDSGLFFNSKLVVEFRGAIPCITPKKTRATTQAITVFQGFRAVHCANALRNIAPTSHLTGGFSAPPIHTHRFADTRFTRETAAIPLLRVEHVC